MSASNAATSLNHKQLFDERFEILSLIGRGRNSLVYKVQPISAPSGQTFALKHLTGKTRQPHYNLQSILREATALTSVSHKNVIRLHDYKAEKGLCYLLMEHADKGDLGGELERRGKPIPLDLVLRLLHQLLAGLQAIHNAGLVHRDIKPRNLLLNSTGEVKIADFGVALIPSDELSSSESSRSVGTLDYFAPEYLDAGVSDALCDVYAAGVTAFQLLTGHVPFAGNALTEQIANKMAGETIPLETLIPDPPQHLEALLKKSLEPNPAERFRSAAEFQAAVAQYAAGKWAPRSKSYFRSFGKIRKSRNGVSPFLNLYRHAASSSRSMLNFGGRRSEAAPAPLLRSKQA